ncbi:hypothetical protein B0T17DRAFT_514365 [Bombardia bombarda]|uniref:Uncharacterized protein n=1 Tax=Bombardia bombarda TaxID=252184 RepID=A0AA40CDH1_9PEZI|nr:hypothetical protein B0T17DRAFT_514365 [Bombardia bombarda]
MAEHIMYHITHSNHIGYWIGGYYYYWSVGWSVYLDICCLLSLLSSIALHYSLYICSFVAFLFGLCVFYCSVDCTQ